MKDMCVCVCDISRKEKKRVKGELGMREEGEGWREWKEKRNGAKMRKKTKLIEVGKKRHE